MTAEPSPARPRPRYIAELLGADAKLAAQLLIANSRTRSAGDVAGGSREATTLIEAAGRLSADRQRCDLLQTHLVTGSPLVPGAGWSVRSRFSRRWTRQRWSRLMSEALQAEMDRAQEELARSRSRHRPTVAGAGSADARDQAMLQEANHAAAVVPQERKQTREELAAQKPEPPGEVLDEKAARDALSPRPFRA